MQLQIALKMELLQLKELQMNWEYQEQQFKEIFNI